MKKLNRRQILIVVLTIISLIIGFLYPSLVNKSIISAKLTNYIEALSNTKFAVNSLIKTNILNNLIENTALYLFTYTLVFFPITILIFLLKSFTIGASITSILYIYKLKGLLYLPVIIIPSILSFIVILVSFYYALSYFILKVKYKRKFSKKRLIKSYLKVLLITSTLQILISFIDSYLSFYFFKLFWFFTIKVL